MRKTSDGVTEAIVLLLKPLSPWVHTLNADNGREFVRHQKIARALKPDSTLRIPLSLGARSE